MRTEGLLANIVLWTIVLCCLLGMGIEAFSYMIDAENFKDTAALASRVSATEVTQLSIRRTQDSTVSSYYDQKLDAAENAYGLAQIQDGFIAVDNEIFNENSRYAGTELPVGCRYIDYLRNNMASLVSRFGYDSSGEIRYDPEDQATLRITYLDSVYGDKSKQETSTKSDAYSYGNASRRYEIRMKYKPRFKTSSQLINLMGGMDLVATVQPINYIEP